jgi:hypothetical protein
VFVAPAEITATRGLISARSSFGEPSFEPWCVTRFELRELGRDLSEPQESRRVSRLGTARHRIAGFTYFRDRCPAYY